LAITLFNLPKPLAPSGSAPVDRAHDSDPHGETRVPGCPHCDAKIPFELPDELVKAVARRDVVLFAGAGISTESPLVDELTFFDDIRSDPKVELPATAEFPDVMAAFVTEYDRRELLEHLMQRLRSIDSFPESRRLATQFHLEMATIPQFDQIITTNWDDYFERVCGALPLVTDSDFALWNIRGRKVLKLHGSINNPGTIVATSEDYRRARGRLSRGALGAALRMALATKVILFVGYSLRDADFRQIYRYLSRTMGNLLPKSYIVTHSARPLPPFIKGHVIQTDGTFFMSRLQEALTAGGFMLRNDRIFRLIKHRQDLTEAHERTHRLNLQRFPAAFYAINYQDGLGHALDRAVSEWHTGTYNDPRWLDDQLHGYQHLVASARKKKRYADEAYIVGYMFGLFYLRQGMPWGPPLYALLPADPFRSLAALKIEVAKRKRRTDPAARWALLRLAELPPNTIWQHRPTIHGVDVE